MIIFVLGGKGLLGNRIIEKFKKNKKFKIFAITKVNYKKFINKKCDIFINANGNSSRFVGNLEPLKDFQESVQVTYNSVFDFKFKHYVFLSSIDVYNEKNKINSRKESNKIDVKQLNHYGFNKYLSEKIIIHFTNSYLILRIGPIVDIKLIKNHLYDMINNKKVYVNENTKSTFMSGEGLANIIYLMVNKNKFNQIYNICGEKTLTYKSIKKMFKTRSIFDNSKKILSIGANISKLKKIYKDLNTEKYIIEFFKNLKA